MSDRLKELFPSIPGPQNRRGRGVWFKRVCSDIISCGLIKLTNESCVHNEFLFVEGENIDHKKFNPSGRCKAGGIYFIPKHFIHRWMAYNKSERCIGVGML